MQEWYFTNVGFFIRISQALSKVFTLSLTRRASLLFHLHTYTGVYTVCVNLYDLTAKSSPSSQSTTMMPL